MRNHEGYLEDIQLMVIKGENRKIKRISKKIMAKNFSELKKIMGSQTELRNRVPGKIFMSLQL